MVRISNGRAAGRFVAALALAIGVAGLHADDAGAQSVAQVHRFQSRRPYLVRVTWPVITLPEPALTTRVEEYLAAQMRARRTAFEREARTARGPARSIGLERECSVGVATATLVSVLCEDIAFLGGAHPVKSATSYTLALPSLQPVPLDALFRPGFDGRAWVRAGSAIAVARAIELPEDNDMVLDAVARSALDTWVVTDHGVRIVFRNDFPFVVASVADAEIDWSVLRPVLDPQGPLAPLLPPAR
jgi:hypothetical protein